MNLVELIEQNTDYDLEEYPLDRKIIESIESGRVEYRDKWNKFCDKSGFEYDAGDLYKDVVSGLCQNAYDNKDKVKKKFSIFRKLSAATVVIGAVTANYLLVVGGLVGIAGIFLYSRGSYNSEQEVIDEWNKCPKGDIVDSVQRIKDKVCGTVYEYTK